MAGLFVRHPENPIIVPGRLPWRMATVFNPGVLLDDDSRFYLYERAAGRASASKFDLLTAGIY